MQIREAYRDATHELCRRHYADPPQWLPPLGPVQSARPDPRGCDVCGEAAAGATDVDQQGRRYDVLVYPDRGTVEVVRQDGEWSARGSYTEDEDGVGLEESLREALDEADPPHGTLTGRVEGHIGRLLRHA